MESRAFNGRSGRLLVTAPGAHAEAFGPREWALLACCAVIWGASFLWIEIGLEALAPPVITFSRISLGAVALALVPRARRPVDREDWPRVILVGVLWMAIPMLLFPVAQQWVDSAVAGMIDGTMPLFTAVIASLLLRRLPKSRQLGGLVVGFFGVAAITLPNARALDASAGGVALLVLAVICYSIAANVAVPLQQKHGSLQILLRAQLVAIVLVAPLGLAGVARSSFAWGPALAMLPLGILSTGVAFVALANLLGRVGAARGAVAVYFVPVVAIALGVAIRGESVHPWALGGTALVMAGAWLTSRKESPQPPVDHSAP